MAAYFEEFVKDPHSTIDWEVLWGDWLASAGNDTIVDTEFFTDDPLLLVSSSAHTDTTATVWLSGGTLARKALVTCRITTAAGRIEDFSFNIAIKEKKRTS